MPEPVKTTPAYTVADDEKVVPVMVYTAGFLYIGDVIVKSLVRVSTWLRTNMAPDILHIHHARCLQTTGGDSSRPIAFPELFLPAVQVIAFHLLPPAKEPLDYDANEPNRRMEPVTAIVGPFRMDASVRIATKSDLAKYIELSKETFSGLYDVEINHPGMASLGTLRVPYVLVRHNSTVFATRTSLR